jgi:hypothetical protein
MKVKVIRILFIFIIVLLTKILFTSNFQIIRKEYGTQLSATPAPSPSPSAVSELLTEKYKSFLFVAPKTGFVAVINGEKENSTHLTNAFLSFDNEYKITRTGYSLGNFSYDENVHIWNHEGTMFCVYDGVNLLTYSLIENPSVNLGYFIQPIEDKFYVGKDVHNIIFSGDDRFLYYVQDNQIFKFDLQQKKKVLAADTSNMEMNIDSVWPIPLSSGFAYVYENPLTTYQITIDTHQGIKKYTADIEDHAKLTTLSFSPNQRYYCLGIHDSGSSVAYLFDQSIQIDTSDRVLANCGVWANDTTILLHNYDGKNSMYSFSEKRFLNVE